MGLIRKDEVENRLGAAGATVYVTGRTTRKRRSEYDRPETIEETAALVDAAGRARLRPHRRGWVTTRRLALHGGGTGPWTARPRHRLSMTP